MPAVTPLQGAPYATPTDPPNGPAQQQALALWTEPRTVMRFDNDTARDTAFSSAGVTPVAGMCAYLADKDAYSHFDGSAWTLLQPGCELGYDSISGNTNSAIDPNTYVATGNKIVLTLPVRRKLNVQYWLEAQVLSSPNSNVGARVALIRKVGSSDVTKNDPIVHVSQGLMGNTVSNCTVSGYFRDVLDPGTYTFGLLYQSRGGSGFKTDDFGPSTIGIYDAGPA